MEDTRERAFSDAAIVEAWAGNAAPWTSAVRTGRIPCRVGVTNQAIVDAVASCRAASVLDLGCGEGWLARELAARGMTVIGADAVPELVRQARAAGSGDFRVLRYEDLAAHGPNVCVDVVVCNFSLLGKASVQAVFEAVPSLLNPGGIFVVQTLHPLEACGAAPYRDGWREGSWSGIEGSFGPAAPWYFRTLASWIRLFEANGLRVFEMREPCVAQTGRPASVIFRARAEGYRTGAALSENV